MTKPLTGHEPDVATMIERRHREIAEVEAQIRAGHPDLQGLCLALADWSAELRMLLAAQTKKCRRERTPAAGERQLGMD